jgi:hypothetical protein
VSFSNKSVGTECHFLTKVWGQSVIFLNRRDVVSFRITPKGVPIISLFSFYKSNF